MNRYISDMHLGHANVLRFDHRPFADVEEMEHYMMKSGRIRYKRMMMYGSWETLLIMIRRIR